MGETYLGATYVGEKSVGEKYVVEQSVGEKHVGEKSVGKGLWVKSLSVKSISLKSLWGKSRLVKRPWVKNILVKNRCSCSCDAGFRYCCGGAGCKVLDHLHLYRVSLQLYIPPSDVAKHSMQVPSTYEPLHCAAPVPVYACLSLCVDIVF